jgi:hypothetical protein
MLRAGPQASSEFLVAGTCPATLTGYAE